MPPVCQAYKMINLLRELKYPSITVLFLADPTTDWKNLQENHDFWPQLEELENYRLIHVRKYPNSQIPGPTAVRLDQ